jgi:hypothetical protein
VNSKMKMPNMKKTILLVGAPVILAVGGLTAMAASAPTATGTPSQQTQGMAEASGSTAEVAESATEPAGTAIEPADTAAEKAAEANEAALPGGGHADAAGQNADIQFEGIQ